MMIQAIKQKLFRALSLKWILFGWVISPAGATSFYVQPFEKTIQQAPLIVLGKVGDHHARLTRDELGVERIYTYYQFQVREVLKGALSPSDLTVRELGGEADGVGMRVSGAAELQKNEETLLLLRERVADGSYPIQGMMMGKITLTAQASGDFLLSGASISTDLSSVKTSDPAKGVAQVWTLSSLRHLIDSQNRSPQVSGPSHLPITPSHATPRSPAALSLQIKPSEERQDSAFGLIGLAFGLILILGVSVYLKTRNLKK